MELNHGLHLAYCTNIHRGEGWAETFAGLEQHTLAVKAKVSPDKPYAIGLRLGDKAARELTEVGEGRLERFRDWLADKGCYVFTINGFPFGQFHGERVKEQVYRPDWTQDERLEYTKLLFDILRQLLPEGVTGSVSTLPGSFKEFITDDGVQGDTIIANLAACCEHVESLREATGQDLHLGLEPEPLGWFETSSETVAFFERFRATHGSRFDQVLGVNYDTCHLGVEFESPGDAIGALRDAGIRISKLHLSSAIALEPGESQLARLAAFQEDVYLHQVVARSQDGTLTRYRDLPDALAAGGEGDQEWRVHFHVPLHAAPEGLGDTRDHLEGALDLLAANPSLCAHLEMETYTWEVLPGALHTGDVVEQLVREYDWTLQELRARDLA
jgi:sugar phosphate isomerase/epimerase